MTKWDIDPSAVFISVALGLVLIGAIVQASFGQSTVEREAAPTGFNPEECVPWAGANDLTIIYIRAGLCSAVDPEGYLKVRQ